MGCIVGIDPGNKGALAFLDPENARMRVFDMPTFVYETTKTRTAIDPYSLVVELGAQPVSSIYLEEVFASSQMGTVSAFNFGQGKGMLLGIAAALQIPVTQVKPAMWKKAMRVPADKRAAVQRACQLFPAFTTTFKGPRGGVMDGRAEAALVALYGAMELGRAPTAPVSIWEPSDEQESKIPA